MIRNLRVLGFAFAAVFAISALTASAARATEFFHSHIRTTVVTGENVGTGHTAPHEFAIAPGFTVVCTSAKFEGTEVGAKNEGGSKGTTFTTETLTVTPTYSGCTLAGGKATVNTTAGECHLKLFAATTETTAGKSHGNVEVACAAGKTIDISIEGLGMAFHVPSQLIPHAVHYTNVNTEGGTEDEELTVSTTASNSISWTCTPKTNCLAFLGAASGSEMSAVGISTAKGFVDNNLGPETGVYEEGPRTGIWTGPAE